LHDLEEGLKKQDLPQNELKMEARQVLKKYIADPIKTKKEFVGRLWEVIQMGEFLAFAKQFDFSKLHKLVFDCCLASGAVFLRHMFTLN